MSGSKAINNAGPYKWDGAEWHFWSLAPSFFHRLEAITNLPRTFVWLYNSERRQFIHAAVHPASPYVNAVKVGKGAVVSMKEAA